MEDSKGHDDHQLLELYLQGDEQAFSDVYDRYSLGLLFFARQFAEGPESAEDLVQEAFVRLLEVHPDNIRKSLQALLYSIIRNLARDTSRRNRIRRRVHEEISRRKDLPSESSELGDCITTALAGLPVEQREPVILRIYSGFTFDEISDLLGEPLQTIVSRYRAGLERLQPQLSTIRGDK